MGALVGVLPKRLHPRPLQQPVGGRGHDGVLERRRQHGGSSLSLRRQPLAQLGFYVDSLEECVAELLRDRAPNLVVAWLYITYSVVNAAGESWDWAFYGLSIGLESTLMPHTTP